MPTFAELIRRIASGGGDTNLPRGFGRGFVPSIAPPQPSTGPDVPTTPATPPEMKIPDYNTPESAIKELEAFIGPRPTMEESIAAAKKEFGDYNIAEPRRADYTLGPIQEPNLWGGLGVLLGGGNLGAYARGAQAAQEMSLQNASARLRAQQDYDTALRNWQAGKAGWTKDIVTAARDRVNAWRSEAATLGPYALLRQSDILKAQTAAHADAMRYLSSQAMLEYHYFALSANSELRKSQLQIQQDNSRIRQAFDSARIAIEQGNQDLARQRLALLRQATQSKMKHEQEATRLLQTRISQTDETEAERGFTSTSNGIQTTIDEISRLQGSISPATQYLLDELNVHLQELVTQRDLYEARLEKLHTQQPQPIPPSQPQPQPQSQPQPQPPSFSSAGAPAGQVWQDPQTGHVWAPDGRGGWIFVR